MGAGVHQLIAVSTLDLDDEVIAIFEQAQGAASGNGGGIQEYEAFHRGLVVGAGDKRLEVWPMCS
jgi:hypothetical protein